MGKLFQPIMLGPVRLANRVVMSPMGLGFQTPDENWPERYYPYIEERCRGETGLIITHFTNATSMATSTIIVGSYDDRFLAGHRRLADLVHRYDTRIFLQIAAFGGKGGDAAPSAIESPNYPQVPRELTAAEIELIIHDFARAAARARQAGFDGVELHGAHTYLVGAFISPHTNRRCDEYGGDFEGRMRFPVEIVRAIKREVGTDFPIGFKFSGWEELEGGVDAALAVRIGERMAREGVAYLHVTSTADVLPSRYPAVSTMYAPRHSLVPLASAVRRAAGGVLVIATGGIDDPGEAEAMIARGDCDLVALGRGHLVEPRWARKARLGQRVRPCIRCMYCYQRLCTPPNTISCSLNPYVANEAQQPLPPIQKKRRVMVVGGGPAGIVTALTAAARGHQVILCEKKAALGGELIAGSQAPFKADIARLLQYWQAEVAESPVEVRLNTEVNAALVEQAKPDALVVAVGATPILPPIPGIQGENVTTAVRAFLEPEKLDGKKAIVLGGGDVGCECAVFLARRGSQVTLVEMLDELLPKVDNYHSKMDLLALVKGEPGITALTRSQVVEIRPDGATVRIGDGSERFVEADWIVVSVGLTPLAELALELAGECADVRVVGDCAQPGRIRDAVVAGDLAGRLL